MRGGTENVYGIVGLSKAIEIAYDEMSEHRAHIEGLKKRMIDGLKKGIPDIKFNGHSDQIGNSLYTVLNVDFPRNPNNEMLLFNLDIAGISASGGSACASGTNIGSHVLAELDRDHNRGAVRFSFGRFNTEMEVDYVLEKVVELYKQH
jgi:cysteine desulfurase